MTSTELYSRQDRLSLELAMPLPSSSRIRYTVVEQEPVHNTMFTR